MKPLSKEINSYLLGLLGEKRKKELVRSLAHGKTVIISGNHCTGKTTLVSVLKSLGYSVAESDNVYELELTEQLESRVRNLDVALTNPKKNDLTDNPQGCEGCLYKDSLPCIYWLACGCDRSLYTEKD